MKSHLRILSLLLCFMLLTSTAYAEEANEDVKDDVYVPWITSTPEVDPGEITSEPSKPIEEEKIDVGKTDEEIKAIINKIKADHAPDPLKIDLGTSDINYYYTSARLKNKETFDISKDFDDAKLIILSALRQYKSWLVNNTVIGTYNSNSDTEMRIYNKISNKTTSYSKFNKVKTIAVTDTTDNTSLYINYNTGECFAIVSLKGEKDSDTKTSCVVYSTISSKDLKILHEVFEGKEPEEEVEEEPIEGLDEDEESDLTHKANVPLANILFIIFIILIVGGVMFFLIVKIKAFMMEGEYEDNEEDSEDDSEEDDKKELKLFGKDDQDENAFDESEYKR